MTIEYENTTRKAIKNPFAKIHEAALNNGGSLPDDVRKKMMGEAIKEIRDSTQVVYTVKSNCS